MQVEELVARRVRAEVELPAVLEVVDTSIREALDQNVQALISQVEGLEVSDWTTYNAANDLAAKAAKARKIFDNIRKIVKAPFLQVGREIDSTFKEWITPLDIAVKELNRRRAEFKAEIARQEEERRRKAEAEAERRRKLQEAAVARGGTPRKEIKPEEFVSELQVKDTAKTRKIKRWRLVDITQVPLAYLKVDEAKVREAMKAGKDIPGIEYYEEEVFINR